MRHATKNNLYAKRAESEKSLIRYIVAFIVGLLILCALTGAWAWAFMILPMMAYRPVDEKQIIAQGAKLVFWLAFIVAAAYFLSALAGVLR